MKKYVPPPPRTNAEREAAKSRRMESLLRSFVRTWDDRQAHNASDCMEDWIAHVASRARSILENYAKPD